MALGKEDKFNPPPQADKTTPEIDEEDLSMTSDEFLGTALLMALARIYDVLLVQVAQTDEDTARALQEQHYKGGYLFPILFEEE